MDIFLDILLKPPQPFIGLFFISLDSFDIGYSMQHVVLTPSTYPGSCKSCFSRIPVFGRKVFLIFPIIYQMVDLKLICMIGQPDLINSLIFADIYSGWHIYSLWGFLFQFHGQLALKFHWDKTCLYFDLLSTLSTLQITLKLLDQSCQNQSFWWLCRRLTGSTTDQIWACELANLLARVSQLCQKLNLPTPKELYRPMFFKHWRHFLDQNYTGQADCLGYGGCSFVVDI